MYCMFIKRAADFDFIEITFKKIISAKIIFMIYQILTLLKTVYVLKRAVI